MNCRGGECSLRTRFYTANGRPSRWATSPCKRDNDHGYISLPLSCGSMKFLFSLVGIRVSPWIWKWQFPLRRFFPGAKHNGELHSVRPPLRINSSAHWRDWPTSSIRRTDEVKVKSSRWEVLFKRSREFYVGEVHHLLGCTQHRQVSQWPDTY